MSQTCLLAVYSDLVGSFWAGDFELNRTAGHLRKEVFDESLQGLLPAGTSSSQLGVYYVEGGIEYDPEDTFRQRLSDHLRTHEPRKIGLLSRLGSVMGEVEEGRVYLVIGFPDRPLVTIPDNRVAKTISASATDSDTDSSSTSPSDDSTGPSEIDESTELEHRRAVTTPDLLPVEVFGPSFAHFVGSLNSTPETCDASFTSLVMIFLERASSADLQDLSQAESLTTSFVDLISPGGDALRIRHVPEIAYSSVYCAVKNKVRQASAPIVVFKAMAEGESIERSKVDRAMRTAMPSCDSAWPPADRKIIYNECAIPVFGVTIVGSWLRVYGSVFTNKWTSQQLTTPQQLLPLPQLNSTTVQPFARLLWALRASVAHLQDWYRTLMVAPSLSQFHHRLHPSSNSFKDASGVEVKFDYFCPLQPHNNVFLALGRFPDARVFIVKFTPTYGSNAHRLLARENLAPDLFYAGPVYDHAGYTRMQMVVMEQCRGGGHILWDMADEPIRQQVRDAVRVLHENGFVHGDLRSQNIMLDKSRRLRVIDFDWAGKEGIARYPEDLSPDIPWPAEAKPGTLIKKEHDDYWVTHLLVPRCDTR